MCTAKVLLVLIAACHTILADDPVTDIKLVHAVFRHGPRTPADTYPKDPHINFTFAPFGWGQLTNVGKLTQFQQGQFLRARYNDFFGDRYLPKLVDVQATGVDRTIMSAQLEMAGMWPPSPEQKWNPDLDWQPAVIKSTPLRLDNLLLMNVPCPRYYYEFEKLLNSTEVTSLLEDLGAPQLYAELTNHTGLVIKSPADVFSVYGTLKAEDDFNLTLPDWTKAYYPDRFLPLSALNFILNAKTHFLKTFKGGPMLGKIVKDSQDKIDGKNTHVLHLYAGHDTTVANILLALGVWDAQVPSYGIMALFELHQERESGEYGIKVFLRNSTTHEPYPLTIPGCNHYCPFTQFVNLTIDVIPEDLDTQCQVDDPKYIPPPPPPP